MVPFKIPAWRKKIIKRKFARKAKVIHRALEETHVIMVAAIDAIWEHYEHTGKFHKPSLHGLYQVSDNFYYSVVREAVSSAKEEKHEAEGKKKLAKPPPLGLPRSKRELEKFFKDPRVLKAMLKRGKTLTDRMRKNYLAALRKQFNEIVPGVMAGEINISEAKKKMVDHWGVSKTRVETVFRTETTTYFAKTQVAYFETDSEVIGFLFDSVRDTSRTDICRSRHGLIYRPGTSLLKENTPACHYNCRSHLIPLANIEYNRKLLADPNRNPDNKTVAPLPKGWSK